MIKFLKTNILFLLPVPLLLNFSSNFLDQKISFINFQIYDVASSLLIFLFLYSVGFCFKSIFSNMTVTFGIISYLFSFFILESIILFFYDDINLHTIFFITNFLWCLFYLSAKKDNKRLLIAISLYFLMFYLNNSFIELFSVNMNIEGDVKDVFLPNILTIYENSFKDSILNPTMSGYPQFLSYIDALIFKISFGLEDYSYIASTSLVFFWLNLLLFSEAVTNKKIKVAAGVLFSLLIINSYWLQFLFTSSLMTERMAGYFLAGTLVTLFKIKNVSFIEISIIFFILSFVYNTKQFFSIMVPILFLIFLFREPHRRASIFLLSGLMLNELSYRTYFKTVPKDHHIRQIDILDTIQDLLLFRDLKTENLSVIFKNLVIDIPILYFLIITICICLITFIQGKSNFELNLYTFLSILNLLLILVLYISAWREMELDSPVRYIYSFMSLYFLIFSKSFERLEN
jgi:hypothetical protein